MTRDTNLHPEKKNHLRKFKKV